jgi:nicotinamide riboside kinase
VYALQRLTANRNTEVREVKVDEAFPTGAPEAERWAAWFRSSGLEGAVARLVSSDPNARAFAERVGLDFVLVDPSRRAFPISSTAVRADPWAAWSALIPELHPFFARIVAFIGPEGGGKSTALAQLAKHYDTASGGEYLSAIANGLTRALSPSDLSGDALTGTRQTVGSVRSMANRFGLIDGDAVQVKLWFERLFPSEKPLALEPNMWNHHYLVFDDHPWTGAPGKDEPEARRRMVHDAIKLLEANGKSFSLVSGPREARPQCAIEAIDAWVKTKPALRK